METFVRLQTINGLDTVVEVIPAITDADGNETPLSERYHPAFIAALVDVTNMTPQPAAWWTTADGGKTFTAPAVV